MSVYFLPDGRMTHYPTDKKAAVRKKSTKYNDGVICDECGACSIKYTRSDNCLHCCRLRAIHFYNLVGGHARIVHIGPVDPYIETRTKKGDTLEGVTLETELRLNEALTIAPVGSPQTPNAAIASGSEFYVGLDACNKVGHVSIRTTQGECYLCLHASKQVTPRQRALKDGRTWYVPDEPCDKCGQRAERSVSKGTCKGCINAVEVPDGRSTADSEMMRSCPDMVVSRHDARSLGMGVFRTGEPCKRGHAGYRYVSTGACIECLRGR